MSVDSVTNTAREDLLDEVILAYEKAVDAGQRPDPEEILARHPDLAEPLKRFFAGLKHLHQLFPSTTPVLDGGTQFGKYEIIEEIGRGAMGLVYKASDPNPKRYVALKMIRSMHLADASERLRFRAEAENAALLDHPNIVPIIEAGEHEGQLYFCMKLIEGESLARQILRFKDRPREMARIMALVARAVHHAHQRSILHRDLKPANILIDRDDQPHVADFGLAKRTTDVGATLAPAAADAVGATVPGRGRSMLTETGAIVGTIAYMAPEATRGSKGLTTAIDVYGLGAILYELLTGRPPFQGNDILDVLLRVREEEPQRPRSISPTTDRDLETVCLKCLRKEPEKRYASAEALADDLERWLRVEPIRARRVSRRERLGKWVRRKPAVAALLATVMLSLTLGLGGFFWQAWKEARAKSEADRNHYISQIDTARNHFSAGRPDQAQEVLTQCKPELRRWEWHYLWRLCHLEVRVLPGHGARMTAVCYSPDGKLVAGAGHNGTLLIWEAATGRVRQRWRGHTNWVNSLHFIDEGRRLVTASEDNAIKIWDVRTRRLLQELPQRGNLAATSSSGHVLATLHYWAEIVVWERDPNPARPLYRRRWGAQRWPALGKAKVLSVSLSPDGRYLAAGGYDRFLKVWDLKTRSALPAPVADARVGLQRVWTVAFSPNGMLLAAGSAQPSIWDVKTGRLVKALTGTSDVRCPSISFSPDGSPRLAATYADGMVRVWDFKSGKAVTAPRKQRGLIPAMAFSPDGQYMAVCRGREVTIENIRPKKLPTSRILSGSGGRPLETLAVSRDGRYLAARATTREILLWDRKAGGKPRRLQTRPQAPPGACLAFSPDGSYLVSGCADGAIETWEPATGRKRDALVAARNVSCVAFSPDGQYVATADGSRQVLVWDVHTRKEKWAINDGTASEIRSLAFHPDSRLLAACGSNGVVKVCDVHEKREKYLCRGHTKEVTWVAFSPDGKRLATSSADLTVRTWDAKRGRELSVRVGHTGFVSAVCYSPDGSRLASCSTDSAIKIWDAEAGREVLSLTGHSGPVTGVAFSADGLTLISCSHDGAVRLWDAHPVKE